MDSFFPSLKQAPISATWTGPSDRSTTGLPFFGRLDGHNNVSYGLGYSGNGIAQSHMGGDILPLWYLDWITIGPVTQGPCGYFPPEPIRWIGAMMVRNAIRRKENREDAGQKPWWNDKQLAKFAIAAAKAGKAGKG